MPNPPVSQVPVRFPEVRAIREVLSHPRYLVTYALSIPLIGFAYALLLPGLLFGTLALWVLHYLTLTEVFFALAMAILLPLTLLLNLYLWKHPRCQLPGKKTGGGPFTALLLSVIPNALCCTPIIPLVLTLFISGATLVSISAPIQYFLGTYAAILYALSALALWGSIRVTSRRLCAPELTESDTETEAAPCDC